MKSWLRNKLAIVLAGSVWVGVAAAWTVGGGLDKHEEERRDQNDVARMTRKMKTVCVGRLLFDMPEEAQIQLSGARIDGVNVAAFTESSEAFQERLAQREAQLKAEPDRLGGSRNLEVEKEVGSESGVAGKMFVHSRTVTEGTATSGLELERYRYEGVAVEALVHANGISIDLAADDYFPEKVNNLTRLVEKLAPVAEGELPAESGFCVRAYVRDPLRVEQREAITMSARLPKHPDIGMSLILAAGLKPDEQGLLERSAAAKSLWPPADRKRIKERRAAPKNINGLLGDELVESILERDDLMAHSFWWEVNGTRDDILVPHVVFRMHTGSGAYTPLPSSLSLAAATALWDKVLPSFRLLAKEPGVAPLPNRRKASESRRDAAGASTGS